MKHAIILVGHGGIPSDAPRLLVKELKRLETQRSASDPMSAREAELDATIRNWVRTEQTDPYFYGCHRVLDALRQQMPDKRIEIAFNEFCAPSIPAAIDALISDGVDTIDVVTTMFTPGGSHSELEVPALLDAARARHPHATLRYAWPFPLDRVAELLRSVLPH